MTEKETHFSFNLLAPRFLRRCVRSLLFPYFFQAAALAVFALLVVIGLETGNPENYSDGFQTTEFTKTIRKTNITTLLVWGLWWPGLILATLLLGRVWCTVCPMELISNVSRRLSRMLGVKGLVLPAWVRGGFLVLFLYLVMQLLVAGFRAHRVPHTTALILLGIVALALLVGLLFREPRAFCRGFCPAALLLDGYGRLAPVKLGKEKESVCDQCATRDCVDPANLYKIDGRSCPSHLRPPSLGRDDPCVVCFQCAKVCPHDNIGFGATLTGLPGRIGGTLPAAVALFLFVATGFVAHELFSETPGMNDVFHTVPAWLADLSGSPGLFKWFEAAWFLLILPGFVYGILFFAVCMMGGRSGFHEFLARITPLLLPLVAAGHSAKALMKMNKWSVYLPGSLSDPIGLEPAQEIVSGRAAAPAPLVPVTWAALAAGVLLVAAVLVSIGMIRGRAGAPLRVTAYTGLLGVAALYICVVAGLIAG